MIFRKKVLSDTTPDRIRLSQLEPPCRCREPLVDEAAKTRPREVLLDVSALDHHAQRGPVFRAVDRLGAGERLRVKAASVSWPLLALLQTQGERFQLLRRTPGDVEFLVWRHYDADERRGYLRQAVDGR